MVWRRLIVIAVACMVLGGCARDTRTEVTRFNKFPPTDIAGTFAIVPTGGQMASADFDRYAALIAGQLTAQGFTRVGEPGEARYSLYFGYATGSSLPAAGTGAAQPAPVYFRALVVTMYDNRKPKDDGSEEVFEAQALSVGPSGDLDAAMPGMIRAVFANFPGKNGETVRVDAATGRVE